MARNNTHVFIRLVQQHPELYNPSHEDFKDTRLKDKVWAELANQLGECSGPKVKKMWKNLRDAYNKHIKCCDAERGDPSSYMTRYKSWPWASYMSFLKPYMHFYEIYPLEPQTWIEEKRSLLQEETTEDTINLNSTPTAKFGTKFDQVFLPALDERPKQIMGRKRTIESQNKIKRVVCLNRKVVKEKDDVDLLFESYATKLKKMSPVQQATVKFRIAEIMWKAELEETGNQFEETKVEEISVDEIKVEVGETEVTNGM